MASKSKRLWPGGSGASNPRTTLHRNKAREQLSKRVRQRDKGAGRITADALAKHNELMEEEEVQDLAIPAGAGAAGAATARAAVPGAKGAVAELPAGGEEDEDPFASIRRLFNSPSEAHREACAVLSAITESIESQGCKKSNVAYWAALMSALEGIKSSEEHKPATAITFLLSLVFPRVPKAVLKARFAAVVSLLIEIMKLFVDSPSTQALIKSVLLCVSTALGALDAASWGEQESIKTLGLLLSFCADSRPKVRRMAQQNVIALAAQLSADPAGQPALSAVAAHCLRATKEVTGDSGTFHVLMLLRSIFQFFPAPTIKPLSESLLKILAHNNGVSTMLVLSVFQAMFESPQSAQLPAPLISSVLQSLMAHCPPGSDISGRSSWNSCVARGHVRLASLDVQLFLASLHRFCAGLLECFLEDNIELARNALDNLLTVVDQGLALAQEPIAAAAAAKKDSTHIHQLVSVLGSGLRFRFQAHHKYVLQVLARLFHRLGASASPLADAIVVSLAELHETPQYRLKGDVEQAVAAAIKAMGPEKLLAILPLQLDSPKPQENFPRAWLLPLMATSISHARLGFAVSTMLPLAAHLLTMSETCKAQGQAVLATTYHTLHMQVWSLLPGFCESPTDLEASFKNIARVLGTALTDRPDLRSVVCRALQTAIKTGGQPATLGAFAKNFLPVLFNVYTSCPPDQQKVVLDTIESYVGIADAALLNTFFRNVIKKLLEASKAVEGVTEEQQRRSRHDMMDLALTMLGGMDLECVKLLYRVIKPQLQDEDMTLQKKSYKALLALCGSSTESHVAFVADSMSDIQTVLVDALLSASSAAKMYRLKCLAFLVQRLPTDELKPFLSLTMAEVLMCTKEVNERARSSAFALIATVCETLLRHAEEGNGGLSFDEMVMMTSAGLAGSTPHMISATVLALARILFQFRDNMADELKRQVVEGVLVLLGSRSREVVKSCLGFVKVLFSVLPRDELRIYLPIIAASLVNWSEDMRRHFRTKARVIFERLVRKFGYEDVVGATPEEHKKLLVHIKRATDRAKKKKHQAADHGHEEEEASQEDKQTRQLQGFEDVLFADDDEDEEEDDGRSKASRRTAPSRGDMWLREDGDDEPLDFLDPSATRKISSERPGQKSTKPAKKSPFQMSKDGRLIITDPDEDNSDDGAGAAQMGASGGDEAVAMESEDDGEEDGLSMGRGIHRDRKLMKRRRNNGDDDDEEEEDEDDGRSRGGRSGFSKYTSTTRKSGATGTTRVTGKTGRSAATTAKTGKTHQTQRSAAGSEFRSKRAGGDVQRKGQAMQPYAFLPLDNSQLNRRKRAKASAEFKGIVNAARKGSKMARVQSMRGRQKKR